MRASNEGNVLLVAVVGGLMTGVTVGYVGSVVAGLFHPGAGGEWLTLAWLMLLVAVAAAGWGALVLHYRSHPRWVLLAAALVAIEVGISLVYPLLLIGIDRLVVGGVRGGDVASIEVAFGPIDAPVGTLLFMAGLATILAVPAVAAAVVPARQPDRSRPWHVAAGAAWLVAATLGYVFVYMTIIRPA